MRNKIIALGIVLVVLASGMLATGVQAQSSAEGLVAEWRFDEGSGSVVKDSSGNGNDGVIHGATWTDGKVGKALRFDGRDDYVEVPDSASLNFGTSDFTVSMWLKYPSQAGGTHNYAMVYGKYKETFPWKGINIFADCACDGGTSGKITFRVDANNCLFSNAPNLNDNIWRYFTFVRTGTTLKIYINGALDNSIPISTINIDNSGHAIFGANSIEHPTSQSFNGKIDEVRIYNRALTADEIKTHYERKEYPTPSPTPPAGKTKAIWLYNPDKHDSSTLITDLKSAGINTVFLSTDVTNVWSYERFVKSAHENGMKVHAMILAKMDYKDRAGHHYDYMDFYNDPAHKAKAVSDVEKILDYNEKSLAKFDGINVDLEPYTSDLWFSDERAVWNDYVDVLSAIREKTRGKITLSADVPCWYDETKIKDMAPNLDFFAIMAYDSGGAGWTTASEIEDAVASEMGAIRGEGAKAVIGIGVHEGFEDKGEVQKCVEDMFKYYSGDSAFMGVAIFKYALYADLAGAGVPVTEAPKSATATKPPEITPAESGVPTTVSDAVSQHKILLDTSTEVVDTVSYAGTSYQIVKYDNILPYAGGIEVFSADGSQITDPATAKFVLTSTAWKEAAAQLQPSDINTLSDILKTSEEIHGAVSPVASATSSVIGKIGWLKDEACVDVPFVGKKCAWDAVTASYPGMSTLEGELVSLNSELREWEKASAKVSNSLPDVISGFEGLKAGNEMNPELETNIQESMSAFGTLQTKTDDMSGRLSDVIGTLSGAESAIRSGAGTPIVGDFVAQFADYVGDLNDRVRSLRGDAQSFSRSLSESSTELSNVLNAADAKTNELYGSWESRRNAVMMVYATVGGIIAVIFVIIGVAVYKRKKR